MKKAVITGPTGAIGVALIENLIAHGVEVTAVCREGSERVRNIPEHPLVHIVFCNLSELSELPELLSGTYDVFYHFGWDGTFGNARNNMQGQLQNIRYTLDAVDAAEKLGCEAFVGAGSQAEYGRFEGKLNAEVPVHPENGYGIAKLCAGQMSRILCEQKKIRHVWTRILSIYGPYDGQNTMIMSTIRSLIQGERPALTKGEQEWDYLYSQDAGKALFLLGEKGKHGKTYCIGSGRTRKLSDYVKVLRDCISEDAALGFGEVPYQEKQVMYLCADISELTEDTGFTPEIPFEEGIRRTVDWYRKRS